MSASSPATRVKVSVVELRGVERLVARVACASGSEGDIPIASQEDLARAVATHGYDPDEVAFGDGASCSGNYLDRRRRKVRNVPGHHS